MHAGIGGYLLLCVAAWHGDSLAVAVFLEFRLPIFARLRKCAWITRALKPACQFAAYEPAKAFVLRRNSAAASKAAVLGAAAVPPLPKKKKKKKKKEKHCCCPTASAPPCNLAASPDLPHA